MQGVAIANVGIDSTNGHVHFCELVRCVVGLLAVYCNIANAACVFLNELFTMRKHSATSAAWIINTALIGLEHCNK
jgi:hypothetical protein